MIHAHTYTHIVPDPPLPIPRFPRPPPPIRPLTAPQVSPVLSTGCYHTLQKMKAFTLVLLVAAAAVAAGADPAIMSVCKLCRTGIVDGTGLKSANYDCSLAQRGLGCAPSAGAPVPGAKWKSTAIQDGFCGHCYRAGCGCDMFMCACGPGPKPKPGPGPKPKPGGGGVRTLQRYE